MLYPFTEKVGQDKDIQFISHDGTEIKIRFIDLFDLKRSLKKLIKEIMMAERGKENDLTALRLASNRQRRQKSLSG